MKRPFFGAYHGQLTRTGGTIARIEENWRLWIRLRPCHSSAIGYNLTVLWFRWAAISYGNCQDERQNSQWFIWEYSSETYLMWILRIPRMTVKVRLFRAHGSTLRVTPLLPWYSHRYYRVYGNPSFEFPTGGTVQNVYITWAPKYFQIW